MNPSREARSAGAILLAALLYRLYAMTGDMLFDPVVYAQNAYNLLEGTFTLRTDSWFSHRLTVFLPVAPLYAAFDVHPWTSKLWPLLCSMVQLILGGILGARLFGNRVALVGMSIAALAPLDVLYGTVLNPDIIISTFLTGSAVCWILGHERDRPRPWLLYLAGFCLALAIVTRLFGVILLPFFGLWILWKRPRATDLWRGLGWAAAGVATVMIPLAAAYYWQTGDVTYRLGVVSGRYGEGTKSEGPQFWYYPSLLLHPRFAITGLAPHAFMIGLLGALLRPTRARLLLLAWILPVFFYLQFGSMSVGEYIPILKRERFLLPLTIPLALLTASIGVSITRELARARPRLGAALLVLALAVFGGASALVVERHRADGERQYRAFLDVVDAVEREPDRPVLFDHWRTGYRFSYYFGFREGADFYRGGADADRMGQPGDFGDSRLGYLRWYPTATSVPRAFVVLDDDVRARLAGDQSVTRTYRPEEVPDYADPQPASWELVGRYGTFRLFRNGL